MTYIPLKPTPIRERASILFLEHGQIDVSDQAFVLIDDNGRTHIPVAGLACLMLERLIPAIHDVLAASGIDIPADAPEGVDPVLPREEAA